MIAHCK